MAYLCFNGICTFDFKVHKKTAWYVSRCNLHLHKYIIEFALRFAHHEDCLYSRHENNPHTEQYTKAGST